MQTSLVFLLLFFCGACVSQTVQRPTPLLSGIVLDVEPYLDNDHPWGNTTANQYVDLLERVKAKLSANAHNLPLAVCVPFWFDTMYIERYSVNKTLLEYVIETSDRVVIMAYRDWAIGDRNSTKDTQFNGRGDSVMDVSTTELELGKANSIEIIVETLCIPETPYVSFCEEDSNYLEQQLAIIETEARKYPSYYGKSVHYYPPWAALTPHYSFNVSSDCSRKRSMFLWEESDVVKNDTYRHEMIQYSKTHGVSSLMLSAYTTLHATGNFDGFSQTLREIYDGAGIPVEGLYGNFDWHIYQDFALSVIDSTLTFLDEIDDYSIPAPDPQQCDKPIQQIQIPASFHFNLLPHMDASWDTNTTALANEFLDNLQVIQDMVHDQCPEVLLSVSCPFWYDTVNITRNSVTRPLHEWIIDIADRIIIMGYRSWANGTRFDRGDSIENLIQEESQYAQQKNKKFSILLNVYPDENSIVTFNNDSTNYLEQQIDIIYDIYKTNSAFDGIRINSQEVWESMTPSYSINRSSNRSRSVYVDTYSTVHDFAASHGVTNIVINGDIYLVNPYAWKDLRDVHEISYEKSVSIDWYYGSTSWSKKVNQDIMVQHLQLAIDWVNSLPHPIAPYSYVESTTSTTETTATTTVSEMTSTTPSDDVNIEKPKHGSDTGAIVGGVVGGVVGLCFLIVGVALIMKKNKAPKKHSHASSDVELANNNNKSTGNSDDSVGTNYGNIPSKKSVETTAAKIVQEESAQSVISTNSNHSGRAPRPTLKSDWKIDYSTIQIEKEIGRGAYGVVFKGKWRASPVAVKKMKTENMSEKDLEDFHHEVELMKNLRPSPNVVILLGVCDDPLCIVTEYYEGGSLHACLSSGKELSQEILFKITLGIARGMLHLHMENIIHRDLAARNVLLGADYVPKISDFGLSRVTENQDGGKTESNVGPLLWMAPECLRKTTYGFASDVWAFGITIIEMYTRDRPYADTGYSNIQIASAVMRKELKPTLPSGAPKPIIQILQQCFEFEPQDRPDFASICANLEQASI